MKLATHNSATGERGKNLLHSFFSVFAKCQDKTIREQYEAGVRYFDLRVDKDLNLCHGLWKAKKSFADIMGEIAKFDEEVYVAVCIERGYDMKTNEALVSKIRRTIYFFANGKAKLVYIAKKKPKWEVIVAYRSVSVKSGYISVPTPKEYLTLVHKDWWRYIPIPRILKRFTPMVEYDGFVMRDFV